MDFVHLCRLSSKQSCWKPWSLHPSQPEVRAVGMPGMRAELRYERDKVLCVPAWISAPQCCARTLRAGKRRQIEQEQLSRHSLLGQAPPDADNGLVYCTPRAAQLIWPNTVIYGRLPCLILLMFILIHNAEAGLTNSGTKVLAANMSQYGQVAFSHVN